MTVQFVRKPVMLTRKSTSVEHRKTGGDVAALVETDIALRPYNTFCIIHYDARAKEILANTPYAGVLSLNTFQFCAECHEVSHVVTDCFDYDPKLDDWLFNYIDNILCDDNNENKFMRMFPDYAIFVQILLSCMKWDTPDNIKGSRLDIDLSTLFLMARFGVIRPGADAHFVSFALPLILSSRRGNRLNTLQAAYTLYEYLHTKNEQTIEGHQTWMAANGNPTSGTGKGQKQVPLSPDDIDKIINGSQFMDSANLDVLKNAVDSKGKPTQQLPSGKLAGLDGPKIDDAEQTDEFYTQTCYLYPEEITQMRNAFLMNKYKWTYVDAIDGELGRLRRQAYKDMLMGEERKTRVGLKQIPPWVRVGVLCDISSSTLDFSIPYMRAVVVTLASIEDIDDVKAALAFFNSNYKVLMHFGDEVSKTRIRPNAYGGTVLHNLLHEEVEQWDWEAKNKYLVIITDGDIAYWETLCLQSLERLTEMGIQCLLIEIVTNPAITTVQGLAGKNPPDWLITFASTIEDLPGNIMGYVGSDV